MTDASSEKPLPDPSKHPDLLPKRKRLNPAVAAEYRRQGRLFFGAALFFGFGAIVLLGIMAMNQEPSNTVVTISILAMVMSAASLIFGIVRLCQAAGANQGCAAVLAILVGAILTFAMIYQLIWFFFVRNTDSNGAQPGAKGERKRSELRLN